MGPCGRPRSSGPPSGGFLGAVWQARDSPPEEGNNGNSSQGIPSLSVSALEHFMTVTLFAPQARGLVFLPELEESPRGAGLGQGATGGCLLLTGRSGQDEAAAWGNGGMGC